jgi:exodeoxyribonuclease V alpha subunit
MVAVTGQSLLPAALQSLSVLERITYAGEDTGYTIAQDANDRTGPDLLTVVGRCWAPRSACG